MVVLFLIGGMTTTAILGEDRSFTAAMTGVFTVGLMHFAVWWLKLRSKLFERIIDGTPIIVFYKGEWLPQEMRRLRMQRADVRTAMRQQGMIDEDKLLYVIVERDGTISLIPAD